MTSEIVIPDGWSSLKVTDVTVEHKQGYYTSEKYNHEGVRLVRITDLQNPKIVYSEMPRISIDNKTFDQFKAVKGDFLIARSGAIGRFGIVTEDIPCIFGSYIIRFRFDSTIIDNDFMGFIFQSHSTQKQLQQFTQGASNQNINANNIKKISIVIPKNINEQHKIASILSKVDEHISHTEVIIEKTEELKRGLMQQLLTKGIGHTKFKKTEIGVIPEEWDVKKINQICDVKTGGTPSTKRRDYWNGDILWMSSGEINNRFIYITEKKITTEGMNSSNARILPANSVMMALNGQGKTRGTVAVLKVPSTCNQSLACMIPNKDVCDYLYLYYNLQSRYSEIRNYTGNTGREGLNLGIIKDIDVPLPCISEQHKIASILYGVDAHLSQNQTYLSHLQELKKGLMQDLLTGKVRVTL